LAFSARARSICCINSLARLKRWAAGIRKTRLMARYVTNRTATMPVAAARIFSRGFITVAD